MLEEAKAVVERLQGEPVRVAVHQPAYHPNIYYFRKMLASDVFVSLDTVQFADRDWQHRQEFFYEGRRRWLTVPVNNGRESIDRKRVVDHGRLAAHWRIIAQAYAKAPYFEMYREELAGVYRQPWTSLRDLCEEIVAFARRALGVETPVVRASDCFDGSASKGELLAELVSRVAGLGEPSRVVYLVCAHPIRPDHYINQRHHGNALSEREKLEARGIEVGAFHYRHPVYPQANVPAEVGFQRELSIVDLIFNVGPDARTVLDLSRVRDD
ncbi:WbqC family protein [Lentzea sp. E54]|uniref:WbqC family protein n=1 Tax=Lentzea xerophila TaxID=3435883 RepID=UPI003DA1D4F7